MMSQNVFLFLTVQLFICNPVRVAAECCTNTGWFSCCGKGPCNIFCCNCGNIGCQEGCGFDKTLLTAGLTAGLSLLGRRKRETDIRLMTPMEKFSSIDKNNDGFLDMDEARLYAIDRVETFYDLQEKQNRPFPPFPFEALNSTTVTPDWYIAMDENKDGFISPHEFDDDLRA